MQHANNHANGTGAASKAALAGHALRNAHLREHSLKRSQSAPPLARQIVRIRAEILGMTRLEFARRSGMSRGVMRDLELGVHKPTRQTLQQFLVFCRKQRVAPADLEEVRRLYAGSGETLEELIGRLELSAGSSRELARRAGISPTTLWEHRRGNFPLSLALLRKLCLAAGEDVNGAESLWEQTERARLLKRGYPSAWAELCMYCARAGKPESHLLRLGLSSASLRRLRYLELPPWSEVARPARALARDEDEWLALQKTWVREVREQRERNGHVFGPGIKDLRKRRGIERRELADLFGITGKKPARIIKHIEEDGFYSIRAFPAALVAVLTDDVNLQERLLLGWKERRRQFHRRRRPETRAELRLAREMYGFHIQEVADMLGYSNLEYQHIERGREPLLESAEQRILNAIQSEGKKRVLELLARKRAIAEQQVAWKMPASVPQMVQLLARREGGMAALARLLRRKGLHGLPPMRLRAVARGEQIPPWCTVERIIDVSGVEDWEDVRTDWEKRFRSQLRSLGISPLGAELRVLIAETDPSLRAFSPRLGFNYSVLIREFDRLDNDRSIKWYHVERILVAAEVDRDSDRWKQVRVLWATMSDRVRNAGSFNGFRKEA
jgi:transcriptional regulator with XRE-family HTH domain